MAQNLSNVASSPLFSWDTTVFESTANFTAEGDTILLQIAGDTRAFKVSRALMAHWSPVFRDMFAAATGDTVTLHNDAGDIQSFLWFIHVDPISFSDYTANCPAKERFRRALGIATIANFYESSTVTKWAVAQLLLDLSTHANAELLPRLHRLASSCRDISPELHAAVREQWCTLTSSTADPVAMLSAAKDIDDSYLQAYAYFHILQKTNGEISEDRRLTSLDRIRLLVGSMNLRRYEDMNCPCVDPHRNGHYYGISPHKLPRPQATTDAQLWSPKTATPLKNSYEQHSLWEMFTVSPVGLVLHDGVELSQPPAPPTSSV